MGNIEKFDMIADMYESDERVKASKIISDAIRACVIDAEGKRAVDYGCGTGLIGMDLLDIFDSVLFIDASQNMIEQVKHKIERQHIQTAEALCCDFMVEKHERLSVDYIIVAQVLLHVKETDLLLSRLYSALNSGGHLIIVDFDKNEAIVSDEVHNGFEQEKLICTLKELGFAKAEAKTFYHGEKMFMNQDASLFILDAEKPR